MILWFDIFGGWYDVDTGNEFLVFLLYGFGIDDEILELLYGLDTDVFDVVSFFGSSRIDVTILAPVEATGIDDVSDRSCIVAVVLISLSRLDCAILGLRFLATNLEGKLYLSSAWVDPDDRKSALTPGSSMEKLGLCVVVEAL